MLLRCLWAIKFISVKLRSGGYGTHTHTQLIHRLNMVLVVEECFCKNLSRQTLDCFAVSHFTLCIATHFSEEGKAKAAQISVCRVYLHTCISEILPPFL